MTTLTLNQIIAYLSTSENLDITIFDLKMNKYNMTKFSNDLNVTLFASVLYCLNQQFKELEKVDQEEQLTEFINDLLLDKTLMEETKNDIVNCLNTENVIRTISEYFLVNIFVLEQASKPSLHCVFNGQFNVDRTNIIILRSNEGSNNTEIFTPLFYNNDTFFTQEHKVIKCILNNIDKVVMCDNSKYNSLISNKMKLLEIQEIAKINGISLFKTIKGKEKYKTKLELYNELIELITTSSTI